MSLTAQQAEQLYAENENHRMRLSTMSSIDTSDFVDLHRHVRFYVADEQWARLTGAAKSVLLNDAHSGVRSAALISARAAGEAA